MSSSHQNLSAEPDNTSRPFTVKGLPSDPSDDEFKNFVFGSEGREWPRFKLKDKDRLQPVQKKADANESNIGAYVSYGDDGTTASASIYGDPIQITRFLGVGRSGFFSVDQEEVPEPWFVQSRAEALMERGVAPYGINFFSENSFEMLDAAFTGPWDMGFVGNRWPRFTSKTINGFTLTSQHFVSNGTIFHTWCFETESKDPVPMIPSRDFYIPLEYYRIRELEFTDSAYEFNGSHSQYSYNLGPHERSVIMTNSGFIHDPSIERSEKVPDTVGLVIAVSVNGQIRELEKCNNGLSHSYGLKPIAGEDDFVTTHSDPLEITMAFKLQLMRKEVDWKQCLISDAEFLNVNKALNAASNSFTELSFVSDPHVNFIMRRNLEHILSVCSIPLRTERDDNDTNTPPVALTCGDISGHRLVTSASFFAFQFLLSISEYLGHKLTTEFTPCERNIESTSDTFVIPCSCSSAGKVVCQWEFSRILRNRIKDTCEAHLNWIISRATFDAGCFAANYWATGKFIKDESSREEVLSKVSLTDTPFQLLKIAEFASKFPEKLSNSLLENFKTFLGPWLKKLDEENARGYFAFPRPDNGAQSVHRQYRLDDHVWIWRVLWSAEDLGLTKVLTKKKKSKPTDKKQRTDMSQSYSAAEFQRQVLSRFTTENDVNSQRMLAVSRTASENRFNFRSRHTVFFYTSKIPFFTKSNALWTSTIDAQKFHKTNQDSRWDNPLRYGLALLMGKEKYQINARSPRDMADHAESVLLGSVSESGIFPGYLNVETKEPKMFPPGQRDSYWHASFEIPYLLWIKVDFNFKTSMNLASDISSEDEEMFLTAKANNELFMNAKAREMKDSIPFNKLIDQKNIVELSDEWLYPLPNCFKPRNSETIIPKETEKLISEQYTSEIAESEKKELRGVILDVPTKDTTHTTSRANNSDDLENEIKLLNNDAISQRLEKARTRDNAKKRIIWLPSSNHITLRHCVLASPEPEMVHLSTFFGRHIRKEKYFFDETSAIMNIWNTEFHLSVYKLVAQDEDDMAEHLRFLGGEKMIRRAGIGFRFVGDFWDRYWTCHILEYEPNDVPLNQNEKVQCGVEVLNSFKHLIQPEENHHGSYREQRPWRQRKVLELYLFDRMLQKITECYEEMLKEIDKKLREEAERRLRRSLPRRKPSSSSRSDILSSSNALFSLPMSSESYSSFSKQWPPFQYTLQVIEEDLQGTLERIELWRNREKDRQLERPRWTRDDERKYRSSIDKATTSNDHKIRELEHYLAIIQSLRTSLTSNLESTRNELSFQSAENVRFFTYVTVIFLPLGFATAVFSMGEGPSSKIILSMVITAIITLLLTAIALASVQFLGERLFKLITEVGQWLRHYFFGFYNNDFIIY
ncbi:hypothetical protein ACMFMG_011740 [Clarireedia jacksonii]